MLTVIRNRIYILRKITLTTTTPKLDEKLGGDQGSSVETFKRPVRLQPPVVRLGFIPNEWFEFFYKKTGVTGFGTLCFAVGTFIFSKEYFIVNDAFSEAVLLTSTYTILIKKLGPSVAKYLDEEVDAYANSLTNVIVQDKNHLNEMTNHEKKLQWSIEGKLMLVAVKRDIVALQLEAAYRERLMIAYKETIKRLEYAVVREAVEKAMAKRCMANWVIEEVKKSVAEQIEADDVAKSLESLKSLADQFKKLQSEYPPPDFPSKKF